MAKTVFVPTVDDAFEQAKRRAKEYHIPFYVYDYEGGEGKRYTSSCKPVVKGAKKRLGYVRVDLVERRVK